MKEGHPRKKFEENDDAYIISFPQRMPIPWGVVDLSKPSEYIVHLVLVPVLSQLMQRGGVRILLCDRASLRKRKKWIMATLT